MTALLASIAALFAGPAVVRRFGDARGVAAGLDGFAMVAIGGLALLHLLPEGLAAGGLPALAAAVAGLTLPALVERYRRSGTGVLWLAAAAGLAVHAAADGAGLAMAAAGGAIGGHGHHGPGGDGLGLAVVLHRLPVGLVVYLAAVEAHRPRIGVAVLAALAAATAAGYATGGGLVAAAPPVAVAAVQCFVVGSLLHVVLHAHTARGHACPGHGHDHDELAGGVPPRGPEGWWLDSAGAGAVAGGLVLAGTVAGGAPVADLLAAAAVPVLAAAGVVGLVAAGAGDGAVSRVIAAIVPGVAATWALVGGALAAAWLAAVAVALVGARLVGGRWGAAVAVSAPLPSLLGDAHGKWLGARSARIGSVVRAITAVGPSLAWLAVGLGAGAAAGPVLAAVPGDVPAPAEVAMAALVALPWFLGPVGAAVVAAAVVGAGGSPGAGVALLVAGPLAGREPVAEAGGGSGSAGDGSGDGGPAMRSAWRARAVVLAVAVGAGWGVDALGVLPVAAAGEVSGAAPGATAAATGVLTVALAAALLLWGPRRLLGGRRGV